MHSLRPFYLLLFFVCVASFATAETARMQNGSDSFVAGNTLSETLEAERDVFVGGQTVVTKGTAKGDLHVSGFSVDIETDTGGDLYAAGATVTVRAPVLEDASIIGMTVRLSQQAEVNGNARLMGQTVIIDGPIEGALSATGREVYLDAPVTGDAWITAKNITFGPSARIEGSLLYASDEEMLVPERVIDPTKVTFEKFTDSSTLREMHRGWEGPEYPVLPSFMSVFAIFLITLAFIVIIGAIFLTFLPKPVERMRVSIAQKPGQIILVGVIGLSILFGMVPVASLTVVLLPMVPIVILAIILVWWLGYILGAYSIAVRLWQALNADAEPTKAVKLLILAAAIIIVAVLNFIPFVGWIVNYTLVLLGVGAMTTALFEWMIGNPGSGRDIDMQPIE